MPEAESLSLRLPGENGWELWLREGKKGWKLAEKDDGKKGDIFAIESLAIDSSPFWLMGAGDTEANLEATAALRWDALGHDTEGEGLSWLYWQVAEEEGRVLAATVALATDGSESSWSDYEPEIFELYASMLPIPSGECALWMDLGRYVLGFVRGDRLLHVTVLNARVLDAAAAWEVHDLALSLEVRGFVTKLKGMRLWTEAGDEFTSTIKEALDVRVRQQPRPAPTLPAEPSGLLPPSVAVMRLEQLQRARMARIIGVVVAAYIAFFTAWAGWLWLRDHRVSQAEADLAVRDPEVQSIRDAQQRWLALEAATDPNHYPVEMFHQIVSLLPPEGIQFQRFALTPQKMTVIGVASTTGLANKFKADVEANESLKRYEWTLPPINVLEDNRASFTVDGVLAGTTADE